MVYEGHILRTILDQRDYAVGEPIVLQIETEVTHDPGFWDDPWWSSEIRAYEGDRLVAVDTAGHYAWFGRRDTEQHNADLRLGRQRRGGMEILVTLQVNGTIVDRGIVRIPYRVTPVLPPPFEPPILPPPVAPPEEEERPKLWLWGIGIGGAVLVAVYLAKSKG